MILDDVADDELDDKCSLVLILYSVIYLLYRFIGGTKQENNTFKTQKNTKIFINSMLSVTFKQYFNFKCTENYLEECADVIENIYGLDNVYICRYFLHFESHDYFTPIKEMILSEYPFAVHVLRNFYSWSSLIVAQFSTIKQQLPNQITLPFSSDFLIPFSHIQNVKWKFQNYILPYDDNDDNDVTAFSTNENNKRKNNSQSYNKKRKQTNTKWI